MKKACNRFFRQEAARLIRSVKTV